MKNKERESVGEILLTATKVIQSSTAQQLQSWEFPPSREQRGVAEE